MLPNLAKANLAHCEKCDAVLTGHHRMRALVRSDCADGRIIQFREIVANANKRDMASLRVSVGHVVCRSAKEQMGRSNTTGHVAPVADEDPGRNGAIRDLVSQPMSQLRSSLPCEPTIARLKNTASPNAASRGLVGHGVMLDPLTQGKSTGDERSCYRCGSHGRGSFARVVRAGPRASNANRPVDYAAQLQVVQS